MRLFVCRIARYAMGQWGFIKLTVIISFIKQTYAIKKELNFFNKTQMKTTNFRLYWSYRCRTCPIGYLNDWPWYVSLDSEGNIWGILRFQSPIIFRRSVCLITLSMVYYSRSWIWILSTSNPCKLPLMSYLVKWSVQSSLTSLYGLIPSVCRFLF